MDSDDWIENNYIEELHRCVIENDAEISMCGRKRVYDGGVEDAVGVSGDTRVMSGFEAMQDFFTIQRYGGVVAVCKLYLSDIFKKNKIEFPVGKIHEDNFTVYKTYHVSKKVAYVNQPLYNHLQRSDSIMGQSFNEKNMHKIEALDEARKYIEKNKLDLKTELDFYEFNVYTGLACKMADSSEFSREHWNKIRSHILNNIKTYMKKPIFSMRTIAMIALIWSGPLIFKTSRWALRLVKSNNKTRVNG